MLPLHSECRDSNQNACGLQQRRLSLASYLLLSCWANRGADGNVLYILWSPFLCSPGEWIIFATRVSIVSRNTFSFIFIAGGLDLRLYLLYWEIKLLNRIHNLIKSVLALLRIKPKESIKRKHHSVVYFFMGLTESLWVYFHNRKQTPGRIMLRLQSQTPGKGFCGNVGPACSWLCVPQQVDLIPVCS